LHHPEQPFSVVLTSSREVIRKPIIKISNSQNIQLLGYGGNTVPFPSTAIFDIEDSKDILITSLFNQPRLYKDSLDNFGGVNVNPHLWHMVIDKDLGDKEFKVPPLMRPVVYKRGITTDTW